MNGLLPGNDLGTLIQRPDAPLVNTDPTEGYGAGAQSDIYVQLGRVQSTTTHRCDLLGEHRHVPSGIIVGSGHSLAGHSEFAARLCGFLVKSSSVDQESKAQSEVKGDHVRGIPNFSGTFLLTGWTE